MAITEVLSQIGAIQATLSAVSLFNLTANLFPSDMTPCDGCSYDYVIVGGGTAGSVVAGRLVEAGFSVLVLEAGGIYSVESRYPGLVIYVKNTRIDFNITSDSNDFTSRCHNSSAMKVPKVLGGAGAVNFMIYSRGNPSNYDKWTEATNDDSWSWKNMRLYFKMSENLKDPTILDSSFKRYFGTSGKVNISRDPNAVCDEYLKGFEKAGEPVPLDNVGKGINGFSRGLFNIDNGFRIEAAISYLGPIKNNPKLHVSLYSLVTKILFDKDKNAIGVEFLKDGKLMTVKAKNEVIITAGPIKSPQLLMLSDIGPKKELKKWGIECISDLPVGRNLQNLIGVYLAFKTNKKANLASFNPNKLPAALVVGESAVNKSNIYPDYETINFIIDHRNFFLSLCGFTFAYQNNICNKYSSLAKDSEVLNTFLFNLNVKSRGQVTLKSNDPEDSPQVYPGYYSNDKDLESTVEQIQDYMKIVSTPYFKDMGLKFMEPISKCDHLGKYSREYWRCYALCMTAGTPRNVGTAAMGAVVDGELCVKGVNKLRVVDASVIPNVVSGPIFGTIVGVAEKAADMIMYAAELGSYRDV